MIKAFQIAAGVSGSGVLSPVLDGLKKSGLEYQLYDQVEADPVEIWEANEEEIHASG